MTRYIDADALIAELEESQPYNWTNTEAENQEEFDFDLFRSMINEAPTADVVERKCGEWIGRHEEFRSGFATLIYKCSVCGFEPYYSKDINNHNFCPNCGADMRGDTE